MRADLDETAFARREPSGGEVERFGVAAASGANEHAVTRERGARGHGENHFAGLGRIALHDLFLPVKAHAVRGHGVGQAAGDFRIEKRHQRVAAIHQMHFGTQRGERAGIFAADHAAADHDELLRQRLEFEDFVRVMHAVVLEGELRRSQGRRTCGDENLLAVNQFFRAAFTHNPDGMRIHETRCAVELGHAAQRQPRLDPLPFTVRHLFLVPHEVGDGGFAAERKVHAMKSARAPARKHERGFAQRLAGDGAGVDARAADQRAFSTRATRLPSRPAAIAPLAPAGPPPRTTRSNLARLEE